jgi:hypothetical protein
MPEEYLELLAAMKALHQGAATLPVAEDGWSTRPDADSYGVIALEFEADALRGDNRKVATAWEGSVDLFSKSRSGSGWVDVITETLTEHCDSAWSLNSHQYEQETGLFHWEWTFQVEG